MAKKPAKDRTAMIVAVAAIILIIVMSITSRQRENMSAVEKWVGNIFTPVQKVFSTGVSTVGESLSSVINIGRIKKQNGDLSKQVVELQKEVIQLRMDRDELEELRELRYMLSVTEEKDNYKSVAASIIGKSPSNWFDIFTIDVGADHGVKKDSIVLASNGLVGRVVEVGSNWAKVAGIIDNNSSVSFHVLRDANTQGIVTGSITSELSGYLFDPLAEIVVGDKLITSGLGIFPKGILIGEVSDVARTSDQLLKTIKVEPAVNFKKLNKVLVMTLNSNL